MANAYMARRAVERFRADVGKVPSRAAEIATVDLQHTQIGLLLERLAPLLQTADHRRMFLKECRTWLDMEKHLTRLRTEHAHS